MVVGGFPGVSCMAGAALRARTRRFAGQALAPVVVVVVLFGSFHFISLHFCLGDPFWHSFRDESAQ